MPEIKGLEIFAVGTWNGDFYSAGDLQQIASNFDKVGFRPALKLGHDEKSGDRAFGWVSRIWVQGKKLFADITDVPAEVYKLIKQRAYDTVSSEIFWNLERNGQTFHRALKAVALLGAEVPGVSDLAPLRSVVNTAVGESRVYSFDIDYEPYDDPDYRTYDEHEEEDAMETADPATLNDAGQRLWQMAENLAMTTGRPTLECYEQVKQTDTGRTLIKQHTVNMRVASTLNGCIGRNRSVVLTDENRFRQYSDPADHSGRQPHPSLSDRPDVEIDKLAKQYMTATGEKSYSAAVNHVLSESRSLKQAYSRFACVRR